MIQLASKNLDKKESDFLNKLQQAVDTETTFQSKANKAKVLWGSKANTIKGRAAFDRIVNDLNSMCVYTSVCNYCEQNEANDIEHIYPKSFFPQHTFVWTNFILACKQCNSGHKIDKCYIIDNQNNLSLVPRATQPANNQVAFINIRIEDPNDFMILNPLTYKFEIIPGISILHQKKAEGTLKILELNERDTLLAARESASRHFYWILNQLSKILATRKITTLQRLLTPHDNRFDLTKPLDEIKHNIKKHHQKYISTYQHPSVWHAIKVVQSRTDPKWIELFQKIPEALTW